MCRKFEDVINNGNGYFIPEKDEEVMKKKNESTGRSEKKCTNNQNEENKAN